MARELVTSTISSSVLPISTRVLSRDYEHAAKWFSALAKAPVASLISPVLKSCSATHEAWFLASMASCSLYSSWIYPSRSSKRPSMLANGPPASI